MYRIVCKLTNEHVFDHLSDKLEIAKWIDCWVRWANILVQQEKQVRSTFIHDQLWILTFVY